MSPRFSFAGACRLFELLQLIGARREIFRAVWTGLRFLFAETHIG